MARRKPAPHFSPGLYEMYKAYSGGSMFTARIVSVDQRYFGIDHADGKIIHSAFLYTVETPGQGNFGSGRALIWQHEMDRRIIRSLDIRKAA